MDKMRGFLEDIRCDVEQVWSDETASRGVTQQELAAGKPRSFGQCGSTVGYVFRRLKKKYPDDQFYIVTGHIYLLQTGKRLPQHVWITGAYDNGKMLETFAIDITADQFDGIYDKVICDSLRNLADERGIVYAAHRFFNYEPLGGTSARTDILEKKVCKLPKRNYE